MERETARDQPQPRYFHSLAECCARVRSGIRTAAIIYSAIIYSLAPLYPSLCASTNLGVLS